jgi:hypothetical protein
VLFKKIETFAINLVAGKKNLLGFEIRTNEHGGLYSFVDRGKAVS